MAFVRYALLRRLAVGRRLLDVACGTGYGLSFAGHEAQCAVGGDVTGQNLVKARAHMPSAPLVQLEAGCLPFGRRSFDVVGCLEAIYYFDDVPRALDEMARVVAPGGTVIVTYPNPSRPGFNPSPASIRYPSARELGTELHARGLEVSAMGAFPWVEGTREQRAKEVLRRLASRLGLIPRTLRTRALLKRLFYRDMRPVSLFDVEMDLEHVLVPLSDARELDRQPFKLFVLLACRPATIP